MNKVEEQNKTAAKSLYQAPKIELILSANDIERELHYAGLTSVPPPPD